MTQEGIRVRDWSFGSKVNFMLMYESIVAQTASDMCQNHSSYIQFSPISHLEPRSRAQGILSMTVRTIPAKVQPGAQTQKYNRFLGALGE